MKTIYRHAVVFSGRAQDPLTDSFAVADGKFVPAAPEEPGDKVVDLGGAFVAPAFIDAHTHPSWLALTLGQVACLPPKIHSIADMIAALRTAAGSKRPGEWIEGWGYDESLLAEGRSPTSKDLDRVSHTQPVFVTRSDGHTGVVNSVLLKMAGITRDTPDPEGGWFGRDANGDPDGRVVEIGAINVIRHLRKPRSFADEVNLLMCLRDHYLAHGVVTVTDMMADRSARFDPLTVWRTALGKGLPLDASLYMIWSGGKDPHGMKDLTPEEKTGRVRIAGVKLFADGSVSGMTAAVRKPYQKVHADDPDNVGFLTLDRETLWAALDYARRNGIQVSIHVMGDRSLDLILDWLSGVGSWMVGVPSVRLEHMTFLHPDQAEKIRRLRVSVGIATQVIFPFAEWRSYAAALDTERFNSVYPVKRMMATVANLALSSDAPCTTWGDPDDIFVALQASVTREHEGGKAFGPDQALSVPEALSLYLSRAAGLFPHEGVIGCITPGARAHFMQLSKNPFQLNPRQLSTLKVEKVWRDGERVFG